MSRTTRAIASTGLVAIASLGVIAAPAHAAGATVIETVTGSWEIVGPLDGAPGNVHQGNFHVSERSLQDANQGTAVWIGFTDWQCPDGVTSPDAGDCAMLRTAGTNGEDTGSAITLGERLDTASVNSTVPGGWGTPDGGSVRTDFTIDLDFVGAGPLTRQRERVEFGDFTWHVITTQKRVSTASGTVAGMRLHNITAEVSHQSYR